MLAGRDVVLPVGLPAARLDEVVRLVLLDA
jgi:hypothetical protein